MKGQNQYKLMCIPRFASGNIIWLIVWKILYENKTIYIPYHKIKTCQALDLWKLYKCKKKAQKKKSKII